MHQRQSTPAYAAAGRQRCGSRRARAGIQQRILRVPPVDVGIIPQLGPQRIEALKSLPAEQDRPVFRPLLIHVVRAVLERDGGREQHGVAKRGQLCHQRRRPRVRQVFGDFHAHDQVEWLGRPAAEHLRDRLRREVGGDEPIAVNEQRLRINVVSVRADHVVGAEFKGGA